MQNSTGFKPVISGDTGTAAIAYTASSPFFFQIISRIQKFDRLNCKQKPFRNWCQFVLYCILPTPTIQPVSSLDPVFASNFAPRTSEFDWLRGKERDYSQSTLTNWTIKQNLVVQVIFRGFINTTLRPVKRLWRRYEWSSRLSTEFKHLQKGSLIKIWKTTLGFKSNVWWMVHTKYT